MNKPTVILLVEDNQDDELLTVRALKKYNIANEVHVVRDGEEALDYLLARGAYQGRNPEDIPCLVLLDLKLPKVDGLEVLRQIRAHPATRMVPVVVLTSSKEDADVLAAYQLGCNSYIRKPVDFNQFSESIRQLGLYWMVLNQLPILDP